MGTEMMSTIFQNTEAQRTRSFDPHISSVISVPLCFSPSRPEIAEHGYVLTPGRYVGAEDVEDDGVPFAENMEGLTRELATQFHESEKLQSAIRDNMQCLTRKIGA
jgi:type I restriction-modification system DNA methylase subunit